MTSLYDDIGPTLWGLIYHLYEKYGYERGFYELCLRTYSTYSPEDQALESVTLPKLKQTSWYKNMVERYQTQCEHLRYQYDDRFEEATSMTSAMYGEGCSLFDYAEAVQNCVSLLTFTISETLVERFLEKKGEIRGNSNSYSVSKDELLTDMKELVQESLLPPCWWSLEKNTDAKNILSKTAKEAVMMEGIRPTRIGLACQPLTIAIEYLSPNVTSSSFIDNKMLRCRRIRLPEEVLESHSSIATIAKRLASSHGIFLNESAFQKLLLELQKLQKRRLETAKMDVELNGNASSLNRHSSSLPRSSWTAGGDPSSMDSSVHRRETGQIIEVVPSGGKDFNDAVQEADLCLLYRDPEAALINVDLNKADDETVKEFKDVMDIKFKEKALKPGDEGYVYDKRVEMRPTVQSEWDDDSD